MTLIVRSVGFMEWSSVSWLFSLNGWELAGLIGLSQVVVQLRACRLRVVKALGSLMWVTDCQRYHRRLSRWLLLLFNEWNRNLLSLTEMSSFFHIFLEAWAFMSTCVLAIRFFDLRQIYCLVLEGLFCIEGWRFDLHLRSEELIVNLNFFSRWGFLI